MDLQAFIQKWAASGAAERANKDAFTIDLCAALEDVLEALGALGLLVSYELPEGKRWRASRFVG